MKFLMILFLMLVFVESIAAQMPQEKQRLLEAKREAEDEGGGALTAFGGTLGALGPAIPMISYEGRLISDHSDRQYENRFKLTVPVFKTETDGLAVSIEAGKLDFGRPITVSSGQVVAKEWTRMEVGVQYAHQLSEGRHWSIRGAVGYAGDQPSRLTKDDSYSFIGSYGYPSDNKPDYWELFVFLANNSQFANFVPLPGFVYIHRTEHFLGVFGFPVISMQWTPVTPWMFSFSMVALNIQAEAAYGNPRVLQGFFGYGYVQQSYIPSERVNSTDRLFVHEQKVGPGLRAILGRRWLLEGQAGWSFDRSVYIGKSVFHASNDSGATLDASWFGNVVAKFLF